MTWKELAGRLQNDLLEKEKSIKNLRSELADLGQTLHSENHDDAARSCALDASVREELRRSLNENETLVRRTIELDTTVQNTLARFEKLSFAETEGLGKIHLLRQQLDKKDEAMSKLRNDHDDLKGLFKNLEIQFRACNQSYARQQGFHGRDTCGGNDICDDEEPVHRPPTEKVPERRRRKRRNEIDIEELQDLDLGNVEHPSTKRQRSSRVSSNRSDSEPCLFSFIAVVDYHQDGTVEKSYASVEFPQSLSLTKVTERLEIIIRTIWERRYGEAWQTDVPTVHARGEVVCITRWCERLRTNWRRGLEGSYACKDCVKSGRPCLTYVEGGFRLLPLHRDDRKKPVTEREKMWNWVDEDIEVDDIDTLDSDDSSYVE